MAKSNITRTPALPLARDAQAPRRGAAQPPLDLSLGHIGTTSSGKRFFVEEGPDVFRLNVDSKKRTAVLTVDVTYFESADALLRAMAEIMPLLSECSGYPGFGPVTGGAS